MRELKCPNCHATLGQRWANVLFVRGILFPFRRTQDVVCECGGTTKFVVDRNTEKVYKLRVENQS